MVRKITRSAVVSAAALFAIVLGLTAFAADEKKDVSIDDIMRQSHGVVKKKPVGLDAKIQEAAKADKWEDAAKAAATFKANGEALGKLTPDKGEAASWKKLSASYAKSTSDVAAAVEKKDAKAVKTALDTINCKACHEVHR